MIVAALLSRVLAAALFVPALQTGGGETVDALVARVQENLAAIDLALAEAAESERAGSPIERARQAHLAAIRDIDELIRSVKYQRNPNSSSGGGQPPPDGQPPQGQPPPRSSDGSSAPEPKPAGGEPEGGEEPQPEGESRPAGEQPQDGQPSGGEPNNDPSDEPPPASPTDRFLRTDTDARWGVLPPKLQERLLNLHVDDVPERYRDFLDAYVRAVNRQDGP